MVPATNVPGCKISIPAAAAGGVTGAGRQSQAYEKCLRHFGARV
jgi:hypothetical protein